MKTETAPAVTQLIQRPSVSSSTVQPSVGGDHFLMRATSSDSQSRLPSATNAPAKVDLLADFGGDPFASSSVPNQSAGTFFFMLKYNGRWLEREKFTTSLTRFTLKLLLDK